MSNPRAFFSRQDTDGSVERSPRIYYIPASGRDAEKSAEVVGKKATVRHRFPEILGRI